MKVFKFGGGVLKNGQDLIRLVEIMNSYQQDKIIVVVSAFNKVTNKLENLLNEFFEFQQFNHALFDELLNYHFAIIKDVLNESFFDETGKILNGLFEQLKSEFQKPITTDYHFEYDRIVSYGEIISSQIVFGLLKYSCICKYQDIRQILVSDSNFTEAKIDWNLSEKNIKKTCNESFNICVTQGFIAADKNNHTTTLGREGSDFSAAVLAYATDAEEVIFWKEVDGIFNADPAKTNEYVLLPKLSYKESVEQAFYGAKILHPKTITPLQNKKIPIKVKSFTNEQCKGTEIVDISEFSNEAFPNTPIFIIKENQILISLSTKDFSFISEGNLGNIFSILSALRIKVNIMESSAISFSFCVNNDRFKIPQLLTNLKTDFNVLYNDGLELITIRHYDNESVKKMTDGRDILMNQKSRHTTRFVLR